MMECAGTAADHNANNVGQLYSLFTEEVSRDIAHNERIEMMMENALSNREFRVFVQPKYNVAHDKIDSVEALVRWFDPSRGEYMFPAEFIPLFESNGFITKLDHYVYLEVLEFISQSAERGDKVVPVAVNVSRVTAGSEDFINFYVGNKKKYRIPDGFITLEITESFAMEDNDKIAYIIDELHKNGMRCSIDDFGSGYSSFNILKRMHVDELKLDAVFAASSGDESRDDKILSSMIDLTSLWTWLLFRRVLKAREYSIRSCLWALTLFRDITMRRQLLLRSLRSSLIPTHLLSINQRLNKIKKE